MYKKIYRNMCLLAILTLILSAITVLCACYTSFNEKYKQEIREEAELIANFINSGSEAESIESELFGTVTKKVTVVSRSGTVIYDNGIYVDEVGKSMSEIEEALKNDAGERSEFLLNGAKKLFYYAVRLESGNVLRICAKLNGTTMIFYEVLLSVFLMAGLIYLLTAVVASGLTENILKPIENINVFETDDFENVYDEIKPLLKRISHQSNEINRQMNKIASQRVRLQAIMDNINEGLVIIDKNSEIISINSCAAEIFEVSEKQLKHKSVFLLTDRENIQNEFKNALDGAKSNIVYESGGKSYQVFTSPLLANGEVNGAVMLLFDVSEKNLSEKIRREFTANVSHELKTPLTAIHGYAQIIGSGIAKNEDIPGFVRRIEKESSRLIALVEDIIKLSHLDEMSGSVIKQEISLRAVVDEVAENLGAKAAERNVTFEVKGEESTVYANLSQITEMVYNLADNAIKYNNPGGTVCFELMPGRLTVSDNGIGIPEKYLNRIFERFFRVDKSHSKKVNGTGLGLSIVKHLAMINGVDIQVTSVLNEGTRFVLCFDV